MWLNEFGKWLLGFVNSDRFLDWFFTTLFGLLVWLPASAKNKKYLRSKPAWSITSYRNKQEKMLYVRSYITQKVGLLAMLWSLLLAFAVADHQQRVSLYFTGFLVLLVLGFCIVIFVELTSECTAITRFLKSAPNFAPFQAGYWAFRCSMNGEIDPF